MMRICRWLILAQLLTGCMKTGYQVEQKRVQYGLQDLCCLTTPVLLPDRPLKLEDCLEIAQQRNLDLLLQCHQVQIQHEVATGEKLNMLPTLIVSGETSGRSENTGSFSQSLTNQPPAPPSISRESHRRTYDIDLTWNLLDFGVSYFRARQEANKTWIRCMDLERVRQRLIMEITREYWRAVMAKMAIDESEKLMQRASGQQILLKENAELRFISETAQLEQQDELMNLKRTLTAYQRLYHQSITSLNRLMGLPPNTQFDVAGQVLEPIDLSQVEIECLEQIALTSRPELYANDFEESVRADEVKEAMVRMIPGAELFAEKKYDGDKFLLHNNWNVIGAKVTYDLLRLPSLYYKRQAAVRRLDLNQTNRLVISMGVLVQLRLAYLLYEDFKEQYYLAKEHLDVKQRRWEIAIARNEVGLMSEAALLHYELELLETKIDMMEEYASLQYTLEQLNNAIGIPRYLHEKFEGRR